MNDNQTIAAPGNSMNADVFWDDDMAFEYANQVLNDWVAGRTPMKVQSFRKLKEFKQSHSSEKSYIPKDFELKDREVFKASEPKKDIFGFTQSLPKDTNVSWVDTEEQPKTEKMLVAVDGASWVMDNPEKLIVSLKKNGVFPEEKIPAIKQAIECVLNNDAAKYWKFFDELFKSKEKQNHERHINHPVQFH